MCGSPRAVLALRSRARLHVRLHVVGRGASVPTAHFHRTSCARLRAVRRAQMVQSSVQQTMEKLAKIMIEFWGNNMNKQELNDIMTRYYNESPQLRKLVDNGLWQLKRKNAW